MAEELKQFFTSVPGQPGFDSAPRYNRAGDCLIFFLSNTDYYAERVDDILTVYRSFEPNEIVGLQIKGLEALVREFGSFGCEFKTPEVEISLICMASSVLAKQIDCDFGTRQRVYQDVTSRVASTRFDIPAELVRS